LQTGEPASASVGHAEKEQISAQKKALMRRTYAQMIVKQKGFFFAIFVCSVLLSALLIMSFMAFIFRFGLSSPREVQGSSYGLIS